MIQGNGRGVVYLEGLDECPEQCADPFTLAEKLDQSHDSEEAKESDGNAGTVLRALGLGVWGVCSVYICPSHSLSHALLLPVPKSLITQAQGGQGAFIRTLRKKRKEGGCGKQSPCCEVGATSPRWSPFWRKIWPRQRR